jgi:hypothetical protein
MHLRFKAFLLEQERVSFCHEAFRLISFILIAETNNLAQSFTYKVLGILCLTCIVVF